MFKRQTLHTLTKRLKESRKFIQVLSGPRQTGKTTVALQAIKEMDMESHYVSADEPILKNTAWIEQQWEIGRMKAKKSGKKAVLILDEIQKMHHWSETVKKLWDEDTKSKIQLLVVILGSSPLLVQKGLTESLAGRFEIIPVTHWTFEEMHKAFNFDVDEYIYYGGYPGGISLINDRKRWADYIKDSLIETTISKDILLMTRVDKPALLRRLFELGCVYSAQVLSYQKMLGQLQDAGNTTTLAHYLELLNGAGLLTGLQKYAKQSVRQRSSSPKFQVLNTALISAQMNLDYKNAKADKEFWGHLAESAIGAELCNSTRNGNLQLYYWAGSNREVDFVLSNGTKLVAIEVKSGRKKTNLPGLELFSKEFNVSKKLLVGEHGISFKDFLLTPPDQWF